MYSVPHQFCGLPGPGSPSMPSSTGVPITPTQGQSGSRGGLPLGQSTGAPPPGGIMRNAFSLSEYATLGITASLSEYATLGITATIRNPRVPRGPLAVWRAVEPTVSSPCPRDPGIPHTGPSPGSSSSSGIGSAMWVGVKFPTTRTLPLRSTIIAPSTPAL
jgi:hypothetical protein